MYNGRTSITRRGGTTVLHEEMDEGDTDDYNDGHDEGGSLSEATQPTDLYGDTEVTE